MDFIGPHSQAPSLGWPGRSAIPLLLPPPRITRREALTVPYSGQGLLALGRVSVDPSAKPKAVSGRAGAKNKPAGAEAGWRLQRGRAGREPGLVTAVAIVLGGAGGATDSSLNPQGLWEEELSPGSDLWAAPPQATAPPSGWALVSFGSCFGFLGHKTA